MHTPSLRLHDHGWLQRLVAHWLLQRRRRRAQPDCAAPAAVAAVDYTDLAHLSERTLRDIGAPDWVQSRSTGLPAWTAERMRF